MDILTSVLFNAFIISLMIPVSSLPHTSFLISDKSLELRTKSFVNNTILIFILSK